MGLDRTSELDSQAKRGNRTPFVQMAAYEDSPVLACLANPVDTISPAATLSGHPPDHHATSHRLCRKINLPRHSPSLGFLQSSHFDAVEVL